MGLFVFLAGVFLALLGSGAFSNVLAQTKSANGANADQSSNSIYSDRAGPRLSNRDNHAPVPVRRTS